MKKEKNEIGSLHEAFNVLMVLGVGALIVLVATGVSFGVVSTLVTLLIFGIIVLDILEVRDQGESLLRIGIGITLGMLASVLFSFCIPFLGVIIGPLVGGFVVSWIAGFRAGWLVLSQIHIVLIYLMFVGWFEFLAFIEEILEMFGMAAVADIVNKASLMALVSLLLFCGIIWIVNAILCGIGAAVGSQLHVSKVLHTFSASVIAEVYGLRTTLKSDNARNEEEGITTLIQEGRRKIWFEWFLAIYIIGGFFVCPVLFELMTWQTLGYIVFGALVMVRTCWLYGKNEDTW